MKKTTREDFLKEVLAFRQLFGDQRWWAKARKVRDDAVFGLTFLWLNTPDLTDHDTILFQSTMEEFNKRAFMLGKL